MANKKTKNIKDVEVAEVKGEKKVKATKEVKETKKDKKEKVEKEGFIKGVNKEMKKVVWPSFTDLLKYSIAVILICAILIGFFELIQLGMAVVKGLFA